MRPANIDPYVSRQIAQVRSSSRKIGRQIKPKILDSRDIVMIIGRSISGGVRCNGGSGSSNTCSFLFGGFLLFLGEFFGEFFFARLAFSLLLLDLKSKG